MSDADCSASLTAEERLSAIEEVWQQLSYILQGRWETLTLESTSDSIDPTAELASSLMLDVAAAAASVAVETALNN